MDELSTFIESSLKLSKFQGVSPFSHPFPDRSLSTLSNNAFIFAGPDSWLNKHSGYLDLPILTRALCTVIAPPSCCHRMILVIVLTVRTGFPSAVIRMRTDHFGMPRTLCPFPAPITARCDVRLSSRLITSSGPTPQTAP